MAIKLKRPKIKSIPYDDFKDNETYEKLVAELYANGANVIVKPWMILSTGVVVIRFGH